ncbi:MAG TPA: YbaK/EbsC family protein [Nitrospirota bacterium]|nr:YbaK/EbsC family protein [Nitrospirota bacterium]
MKDRDVPVTTAVRALRSAGVLFVPHFYDYVDHGGTKHAAASLRVNEHAVVKTLLMETQEGGRKKAFLVLMHGDREVSTKQLARLLGVKAVSPASEADVEKNTGYLTGGVSPFGTRIPLVIYVEETILGLEKIYINGGKRGFLVEILPGELTRVLGAIPIRIGIERRG